MSTQPVLLRPYRALVYTPTTVVNGITVTRGTQSTINGVTVSRPSSSAISADAVIEEQHNDDMTITENPIEEGSVVTDNAFNNPCELQLTYSWDNAQNTDNDPSYLTTLYAAILSLKAQRTLFSIYTGKRYYTSMLIKNISTTTDHVTENVLELRVGFREAIIVSTQTISVAAPQNQALPQTTAAVVPQGAVALVPGTKFNGNSGVASITEIGK